MIAGGLCLSESERGPVSTFSDLLAAVVVHSSTAAFSHFGVTLDPVQVERPVVIERTVAPALPRKPAKVDCPQQTRVLKV